MSGDWKERDFPTIYLPLSPFLYNHITLNCIQFRNLNKITIDLSFVVAVTNCNLHLYFYFAAICSVCHFDFLRNALFQAVDM